jgi:hypothetical protein
VWIVIVSVLPVRKRPVLSTFYTRRMNLPRQARDKHSESTQKRVPFSCRESSLRSCPCASRSAVASTSGPKVSTRLRSTASRYANEHVGMFLSVLMLSFCQDRLGANIGKAPKKECTPFSCRSSPSRAQHRQCCSLKRKRFRCRCSPDLTTFLLLNVLGLLFVSRCI